MILPGLKVTLKISFSLHVFQFCGKTFAARAVAVGFYSHGNGTQ